ncbi:C2H2-type domain-containing protein [Caenorhabditis elegans]|uniref:C2H2-type domain-containing protein n=1 Tax=Caenorhabditis elegans TaxID=6239 RepID=Q8I4E6_CAEEL|nr:C2H2-type domain-containing protein [Caenorhabditis elegans]CAD56605.1 C2H2-type domain-containing protein [Caenorhabditis elegans]|eukprot:NP_871969.1 Uncharacterized protein CELE_Y17G7B.22 [Caenorhabditis elegans]
MSSKLTKDEIEKKIAELQELLRTGNYETNNGPERLKTIDIEVGEVTEGVRKLNVEWNEDNELLFACQKCMSAFHAESDLSNHEQLTHFNRNIPRKKFKYYCDKCNERFIYEHLLYRHKEEHLHTGIIPGVALIDELRKKHKMTKSDFFKKYPNSCDHCSKNFDCNQH